MDIVSHFNLLLYSKGIFSRKYIYIGYIIYNYIIIHHTYGSIIGKDYNILLLKRLINCNLVILVIPSMRFVWFKILLF